jgi:hypothetical protein
MKLKWTCIRRGRHECEAGVVTRSWAGRWRGFDSNTSTGYICDTLREAKAAIEQAAAAREKDGAPVQ